MDTIPAQPVQEIPVQQTPIVSPPPQKTNFRKFFNLSSWIILFALLPLTVLIFLSQNTIPGDLFYPVKRSLENVILAAASVNPATKAAFRTDLTETRFKEAQSLVVSKSNASGLTTFIDEVQTAQLEVTNLTNNTEKQKAEEKLLVKIDQYQNSLSTLEVKTQQNIIAYSPQENVLPTATPPPAVESPTVTSVQVQTTQKIPSPTPTIIPSPTPPVIITSQPSKQPSPTSIPTPTLTQIPTLVPTVAPTIVSQPENTQVTEQKRIVESIKDTKEKLDRIKKELEEKKMRRLEEGGENQKTDRENNVPNRQK